jgi:hypothetical protein
VTAHGSVHVRFWPKADIASCTAHVRFWEQSRHGDCAAKCLLMTQSGHSVTTVSVEEPRQSRLGSSHRLDQRGGRSADADVRSPYWRDRDRGTRDASARPLWVAYSGAAVLSFWRRAATPTSGAG